MKRVEGCGGPGYGRLQAAGGRRSRRPAVQAAGGPGTILAKYDKAFVQVGREITSRLTLRRHRNNVREVQQSIHTLREKTTLWVKDPVAMVDDSWCIFRLALQFQRG